MKKGQIIALILAAPIIGVGAYTIVGILKKNEGRERDGRTEFVTSDSMVIEVEKNRREYIAEDNEKLHFAANSDMLKSQVPAPAITRILLGKEGKYEFVDNTEPNVTKTFNGNYTYKDSIVTFTDNIGKLKYKRFKLHIESHDTNGPEGIYTEANLITLDNKNKVVDGAEKYYLLDSISKIKQILQ
jgi:hypothetical protein